MASAFLLCNVFIKLFRLKNKNAIHCKRTDMMSVTNTKSDIFTLFHLGNSEFKNLVSKDYTYIHLSYR